MRKIETKTSRFRLDPESYELLRLRVQRRDNWHCQSCGATSNLEVHHQLFRSHSGSDSEQNLTTLCWRCHREAHSGLES
jgi:5-methylcytosine-specific restriction endonuclease McrA